MAAIHDTEAIPPFLFRTAASWSESRRKESRGMNTVDVIDPLHGYDREYHTDLESIEYCARRMMLYDHFKWKYELPSEFSSWSTSLLCVLIHAVYKSYGHNHSDVLIYVMDTRGLPASRIHRARRLMRQYGLHWRNEGWICAEGEYLIHGKLEIDDGSLWDAVPLRGLEECNLFGIFQGLGSNPQSRIGPVHDLRTGWLSEAHDMPPAGIRFDIRRLADCFGPKWEATMLIAFTALWRRETSSENIAILRAEICGMALPGLPWSTDDYFRAIRRVVRECKESEHFVELLRLCDDVPTSKPEIPEAKSEDEGLPTDSETVSGCEGPPEASEKSESDEKSQTERKEVTAGQGLGPSRVCGSKRCRSDCEDSQGSELFGIGAVGSKRRRLSSDQKAC